MIGGTAATPWYADGLAFSCLGCGDCCRGPGGYVWITEEEAKKISAALGLEFASFAAKMIRATVGGLALVDDARGDCPLLATDGGCRVYAERPVQCRTWPWWRENLTSEKRWNNLATRCPGMNHGAVHPRPAIENEMSKDF